jgi:hypothetical protein
VQYSAISRLRQYVNEFKDVFIHDDNVLFCQSRGKSTAEQKHSQGAQHSKGSSILPQHMCPKTYRFSKINNSEVRDFFQYADRCFRGAKFKQKLSTYEM